MKTTIAILALAAVGITTANAGFRFGINFGVSAPWPGIVLPAPVVVAPPAPVVVLPPSPAPIVEVAPACPVAGYIWVGGSWGWCNNRWVWTRGHWGAPVYRGHATYWVHGYRGDRHYYHGERGHR